MFVVSVVCCQVEGTWFNKLLLYKNCQSLYLAPFDNKFSTRTANSLASTAPRPALQQAQPEIHLVLKFFAWCKVARTWHWQLLLQMPMLRMRGAQPLFHSSIPLVGLGLLEAEVCLITFI
jgi:hypothetical protein